VGNNTAKANRKSTEDSGIKPIRLHKSRFRSSVTNGRRILPRVIDGRSLWARRFRDVVALHTADLGGDQNITESERAILRRAATIIVQLEQIELKFAQGNEQGYLLDRYQRCSNTLRRLLESVGLQRRPRDVTPDPLDYARDISEAAE
jgi:hypothetical protein